MTEAPLAALSPNSDFVTACYIVAFSLFIFGIQQGTHPRTARRGNLIAAAGMLIAIAITLSLDVIGNGVLILVGILIGTAVGAVASRRVQMTADAADGGALQRRRRRRRGADLVVGVPPRRQRGSQHRAPDPRPGPLLDRDRLGLLLGIEHRLRQAPGDPPEPPDPVSRAAHRQRAAAGGHPGRLHRARHRSRLALAGSLHRRPDRRGGARQPLRAADRRRRHARGDLAAQRLHRSRGGRGGIRARQRRPDRRRHAGRLLGNHPHPRDEPGDEPLDRQPPLLGLRSRERVSGGEGGAPGPLDRPRGRRDQARLRRLRRLRPRLRHGGRPGTARGQGARQRAREARGRRQLRDPSGRGPDARPHERPARRGRRPLRAAQGDGRDQSRDAAAPTSRW